MEYRITITLPWEPYTWETVIVAASRDEALIRAGQQTQRKELGLSFTSFSVDVEEGGPS